MSESDSSYEIVARDLTQDEKRDLYASVGWEDYFHDGDDPMLFTAVALRNGKAIGAASMSGNGINCFVLRDLMVRPDYQGHGVGGKLLECVLDWTRREYPQNRSIMLLAPEGLDTFYERFGFVGPHHGVIGMRLRV